MSIDVDWRAARRVDCAATLFERTFTVAYGFTLLMYWFHSRIPQFSCEVDVYRWISIPKRSVNVSRSATHDAPLKWILSAIRKGETWWNHLTEHFSCWMLVLSPIAAAAAHTINCVTLYCSKNLSRDFTISLVFFVREMIFNSPEKCLRVPRTRCCKH